MRIRKQDTYQKKEKTPYKVNNWKDYNKTLVNRGSLTLWFSDDMSEIWHAEYRHKGRGHQPVYSDNAIEFILTVRALFRLPLRQTTGFVQSLFALLAIDLPVPDYSQVCRRQASLKQVIKIDKKICKNGAELVVDSSGLKIFGEGEWKVRTHGSSKRRTWRKLHIGIDAETGNILFTELTGNDAGDNPTAVSAMKKLISSGIRLNSVRADGAYDTHSLYDTGRRHGIKVIVPPREGAVTLDEIYTNAEGVFWERDETIKAVREKGKEAWKKESGYHKRSLVEMTFYRYKTVFGEKMSARTMSNQVTEAVTKSIILNKFNELGKPSSYPVKK